jgi:uncharacterized protein YlxW (UPF0749 family)
MTSAEERGGSSERFATDFLTELFRDPLDPGYTDAAERRRTHGERVSAKTAFALRTVVLVLAGFLLAVAYRFTAAAEPDRAKAHALLIDQVKAAQQRTDDLQGRANTLHNQVLALQAAALGVTGTQLAALKDQEAAVGLSAVTGDGVVVTLTDAPPKIDPNTGKSSQDSDTGRVLDVDIQDVVNALWASGAEAIAVNGQRLTATSTIRTAGHAILVDFRPVTSPYLVSAIGPGNLARTFNASLTAVEMRAVASDVGLSFTVADRNNLNLPAAADVPLTYAQPVKPGSPSPSGGGK